MSSDDGKTIEKARIFGVYRDNRQNYRQGHELFIMPPPFYRQPDSSQSNEGDQGELGVALNY